MLSQINSQCPPIDFVHQWFNLSLRKFSTTALLYGEEKGDDSNQVRALYDMFNCVSIFTTTSS